MPPNAAYTLSPPVGSFELGTSTDRATYVKVLDGVLAWVDSRGEIVERGRVGARPGEVASMRVDTSDGIVRSGGEGCVCLRMRGEELNRYGSGAKQELRGRNVLPRCFEWEVREWAFLWKRATDGAKDCELT